MSNLVSNALRHGSPEEPARISVSGAEGGALRISNLMQDPMLEVGALNEPFLVPKRSSLSGNGLGLPIVQAICRTNGWRLSLSKVDATLTAEVQFGITGSHTSLLLHSLP